MLLALGLLPFHTESFGKVPTFFGWCVKKHSWAKFIHILFIQTTKVAFIVKALSKRRVYGAKVGLAEYYVDGGEFSHERNDQRILLALSIFVQVTVIHCWIGS